MDTLQEINYNGYTIKIFQDDCPESPRTWCNLGTMLCLHPRYALGDEHSRKDADEIQQYINDNDCIALRVYLLDHSGLTISVNLFDCPWDSGQVGWIVAEKAKILKEYGVETLDNETIEKVKKVLKSEVDTYNQYLNLDVYGYEIVDAKGEVIDSCWGFYGYDHCIEEATAAVKYAESEAEKICVSGV